MEQYHLDADLAAAAQNDYSMDKAASLEKWKPVSSAANGPESGGFDCNICLDSVQDPVVTLCGHLYCWPCIYKWINYAKNATTDHQQPQCPVCKAEVSQKTLIPLYGRGRATNPLDGKAPNLGIAIPRRPPSPTSCGFHTLITTTTTTTNSNSNSRHRVQQQLHSRNRTGDAYYDATSRNMLNNQQQGGMFGEMVYARIFGNMETTLSASYPNSYYNVAVSNSPRVRRHVEQANKSLSRVCFFFCCCVFLCLLLF